MSWRRWPYKRPDHSKTFSPRPENTPVGTRLMRREKFVHTWADVCLPVLEVVSNFTNEKGSVKEGAFWNNIDFVLMAKFECVLLRMSVVRRNKMRDYWSPRDGDPVVRDLGISFKSFAMIYRNLRMFSEKEAQMSGKSNPSKPDCYDGLFGIRPVWNLFMTAFQKARTPPEITSTDEGMAPFSVNKRFKDICLRTTYTLY